MDRPAIITYVYEYADAPGAVVLKELSPSAEDVLGFPTEEWKADPQLWQRLLHPEDAARVIAATWRTTFQGTDVRGDVPDDLARQSHRLDPRHADVERLPDECEIWRGSWTVVENPTPPKHPERATLPRQNRVTPLGQLIADPARGSVYGNRGCLHDEAGVIRRRFNGKRWIACRLAFRGWHRAPLMQPGRFTELFFLDEATAFAAGHRPCALCRRDDYVRFVAIWRAIHPDQAGADAIDTQLHRNGSTRHARTATSRGADGRSAGRRVRAPRGRAAPGAWRASALVDTVRLRRRHPASAGARTVVITPPSLWRSCGTTGDRLFRCSIHRQTSPRAVQADGASSSIAAATRRAASTRSSSGTLGSTSSQSGTSSRTPPTSRAGVGGTTMEMRSTVTPAIQMDPGDAPETEDGALHTSGDRAERRDDLRGDRRTSRHGPDWPARPRPAGFRRQGDAGSNTYPTRQPASPVPCRSRMVRRPARRGEAARGSHGRLVRERSVT